MNASTRASSTVWRFSGRGPPTRSGSEVLCRVEEDALWGQGLELQLQGGPVSDVGSEEGHPRGQVPTEVRVADGHRWQGGDSKTATLQPVPLYG